MEEMPMYDPLYQPWPSNRYCLTARRGMVITGSNLAASAGLSVLTKGGNAIDAAVAAAAALTVVEPTANGLGSDAFALVYTKGKLYGLNASGRSPGKITAEKVKASHEHMPIYGWTPVTVPGAVGGWCALQKRFGRLSLKDDLTPAVRYAEEGYPAGAMLSAMWQRSLHRYQRQFGTDPVYAPWFRCFGKDVHFGDVITLPDHARTLKRIAETDGKAFYQGEIAEQLVFQSERDGGYFTAADLADYSPDWVEPISVNYRGYDVCELPPNGQGIAALEALNILNHFDLGHLCREKALHLQLEAMKAAFADTLHYVTDPKDMADISWMLSEQYGRQQAEQITDRAQIRTHAAPSGSNTVYLCTADGEGNMVSFIQSNYMGFGSGIVVDGWGVALQNRGADFSLDEKDANYLCGHKKCYHTIIPGFLMKDGRPIGPFGVMGGYMQPQGHVQVITHLLDEHLNPQMALDAPCW